VSERFCRTHFKNACFNNPSLYSCAVDCFLEIGFRLFTDCLRNIYETHQEQQHNGIFEMIMNAFPVYKTAVSDSDINLLTLIREPIWECIISKCPSFVPRNCDAEFSQIFTGAIFNNLSIEEKLLFESTYSVGVFYLSFNGP